MQRPSTTESHGVGVIGLGEMGQLHAAAARNHASSRLAAVADPDSSLLTPFADEGIRAYQDASDLIEDPEIVTVSLCLPHHLHFPVGMSAIAAGKNVLVEKPLAITVDECERLTSAASEAGVTLGVSHNQLFYSAHIEAKKMIDAGAIGRPVLLRLRLGMGPVFGGWRTSVANTGGGLLFDAGVHRIYMAQFLFGPVSSCRAILDVPREDGETFAVAVLQFASGARGLIEANHFGPPGAFDDEIEIVGSEAVLRLPGLESDFSTHDAIDEFRDRSWTRRPIAADDWASTVTRSVDAFLDAVVAGQPAPVTGRQATETMRVLHEIYEAAVVLDDPVGAR